MPSPDDMGLIADSAIISLGVSAERLERIAFRLPESPERNEPVWIVERLRDEEVRLRKRIGALARKRR